MRLPPPLKAPARFRIFSIAGRLFGNRIHPRKRIHPPSEAARPPQAKGTDEGASSARLVSGAKPKEAPLAGYLLARAAMHRKIEGPVLQNLRAGHESVQEVSNLLPLGRSNVREDLQKAEGEHAHLRALASYQLQEALKAKQNYPGGTDIPEIDNYRMFAATSQYAKTGTWISYAANTTSLHAAKLSGMNDERAIVAHTNHPTIDHVWSEMMPRGKGTICRMIISCTINPAPRLWKRWRSSRRKSKRTGPCGRMP